MNRFLLPLGVFALLVVVLAIGVQRSDTKGMVASPLIGKLAPDFVLPSLTDAAKPFDSRTMRGRWYALNVWGTWCPECRVEHEVLVEARKAGELPIVGLNWKDDPAAALDWLAQLGDPYDVIAVDADGRIAINWGVYGAPETFLVDPAGIVVHKHIGALTREIWQRDFISRMKAGGT